MDLKLLRQLEDDVNELLEEAATDKADFTLDPINWGDLGCVMVERVQIDSDGEGPFWRVYIEGAAPNAYRLLEFIEDKLFDMGWGTVKAVTEW